MRYKRNVKAPRNRNLEYCRKESPAYYLQFQSCAAKMTWKPRYGKNRLVEHVRIHWGKDVKKCNICSFSAPCWRKVYFHHKRIHGDVEFSGVVSLETKEDMVELMELWRKCFPDAVLQEFCDPQLGRTSRAKPGLLCMASSESLV
ncbi:hypothetical protein ANCCAN_24037 [Ancylostoma caninum]|uniref:C2H2-type domain-containing protein n=1 Tax=Ancylostoma caninum TaxID=29170 RepID=A0A368FDH7_ANCCA|nr:hypothetical protein ANCCAN_24037 [Ancylostoma caninum]